MNMIRKNLYFPDQLLARIGAHCKQSGERMSSVVRRAVDEFLKRGGF